MSVLCSMVGASFVTAVAEVIRSKKGITAVGNAQVDTAQSKFGGASALFDGTGDFLQTGVYSDYLLGTGDFTIECWFRIAGNSAQAQDGNRYASLFAITNGQLAANSLGFSFVILGNSSTTGTGIQLYKNTNTEENITATVSISQTTWHHAAISKSGTSVRIFFNGTQVGSTTTSSTIWGSSTFFGRVGRLFDTGFTDDFNGHIDELRLSNSARYTANFTPSTTPFVNDDNTLLLIHADGTDATTFFEDDNGVRAPVSLIQASGGSISTTQSKFGGSSLNFPGTSGNHIFGGQITNAPITFGTGNFTVEFWIYPTATSSVVGIITKRNFNGTANGTWGIRYNGSNQTITWENIFPSVTSHSTSSSAFTMNTWSHWAFVRNAGTLKIYVNGVEKATASNSLNFDFTSQPIRIGYWASTGEFNGYLDEMRISDTARYTAAFTAPTQPFVNDANTLLLLHCDGTNALTVFRDDNGVRTQKGIQAIGNAQIDTAQSKFGGASALFDGSGDYLTVSGQNSGEFQFVAGEDFTLECWIRPSTVSVNFQGIICLGSARTTNEYTLYLNFGNLDSSTFGGGNSLVSSGSPITINTWHHVAISRSGTTVKLWVNGSQAATNTYTFTAGQDTTVRVGSFGDGSLAFNGHIDEIRISNTARYTANFTPSTTSFQNDDNTLLLLHMDGTDASTVFFDDNGRTTTP
jgi:hypothetical protein